jgi:hypothetical protein
VPFLKVFVVNNKWGATPTLQNMRRVAVGSTLPSHAHDRFLGIGGFLVPRGTWGDCQPIGLHMGVFCKAIGLQKKNLLVIWRRSCNFGAEGGVVEIDASYRYIVNMWCEW